MDHPVTKPVEPPPVLSYPRDLYVGEFVYRSPQGFLICVVTAAAACAFVWLPHLASSPHPRMFDLVFQLGGLATFGLVATKTGIAILNNSRDVFKLTTVGIEARGKLVPWSEVHQFAALENKHARAFQLCYAVQFSTGITLPTQLHASRKLSKAEYEALIDRLKTELSAAYPHLILGGYMKSGS